MKIDGLDIYKDTRGATLFLLDMTEGFAKKYKFNTADRIIIQAWDLLDEVIAGCVAFDARTKLKHFTAAQEILPKLDVKIQLAAVKQQVTDEDLGKWTEITNRIRRQLEGLANSLEKKVRQSTL